MNNNAAGPKRLPIDVRDALHAICATRKGRCWYCDIKLPEEEQAVRDGWDVQRIDERPVASIILVCPNCLHQEPQPAEQNLPHKALRFG